MTDTITQETNATESDSLALHYLVREPRDRSPKKKAIILLHGVGSNEKDLFGFANQLPDDMIVISARGQFTLGPDRFAWYSVDFSTGKPIYNAEQEASSRKLIETFVTQVKHKYGINELYLGGFSQGGIMSYSLGLTNPKAFKGIISLSGRLLIDIRPLVIENDDMHHLNVFVAHGRQDNTLSIGYARDAKSFLENLGVLLSYHEYDMGHQVNAAVLLDLNAWLTKQQ